MHFILLYIIDAQQASTRTIDMPITGRPVQADGATAHEAQVTTCTVQMQVQIYEVCALTRTHSNTLAYL